MTDSQRRALGKGIRAIIPEPTQTFLSGHTRFLRLEEIRPNPYQPRHKVEDNLSELVASIKTNGLLQPVVVRRRGDGYELVMGERRLRAARQAGLEQIPAVVREATDREMLELALVENLQRSNLNPIEEALAYRRLADEFKLDHEEIAVRVGKDRSTVTNALRLLTLPTEVKELLASGQLSAGHGRALLALSDRRAQVELALRIVKEGLSVRQVEKLCRRKILPPRHHSAERDVHIEELEHKLQERFGTKVTISSIKGGTGTITIYYHSLQDLERVVRELLGKG